ncbi:PAS domain S-box protein [Candidatus Bipolaricaulota bacterium]|nr:PAS domain S-box protein [Candidatus Bipolaricaulota bacterium]
MARVLIVDDVESIRISLGAFVENDGHEVSLASDAGEALSLLREESFDVVVTDIILPRKTGIVLLGEIREAQPDVQVIMITGEPEVGTAAEAVRKGAFDYLSKPVARKDITKTVSAAVKKKDLLDKNRHLEEENRRHREHLEELVEERTGQLRDSEACYRSLFTNIADPIFVFDKKMSHFLDCNQSALDRYGYTVEELSAMTPHDLHPPEEREQVNASIADAESHSPNEYTHITKDGEHFPAEVHTAELEYQGRRAWISIVRDITERKQAEKLLQEAHNIISQSPVVAFLWKNEEGWPVEYVSENVENLFGYTVEEVTSGEVAYAELIHPDDLERVSGEVAVHSKDKESTAFSHAPYRIVTKSGATKWVDDRTVIRRDGQGQITHYQGILIDITAQVQAEEREEEHYKNIEFLSETAMRFVDFPEDDDIYRHIGDRVRKLAGESIVVVNSIDEAGDVLTTRAVLGLGKISTRVMKLIGRNPEGMTFDARDEDLLYLSDGRLHDHDGGLYAILLKAVPKPICAALEKLYDIGNIYTLGFTRGKHLFGTLIIILSKGRVLRAPEIVETFVQQASIALQRKRAEERTKRLLDQQVAINELSLALGEERNLDSIYHTIYGHVSRMMDATAFIISFYEGKTNLIRAEYVLHEGQELNVESFPPIPLEEKGHGTQSQVFRTGKPLYFPNYDMARIRTEPRTAYDVTVSNGASPTVQATRGEERSSLNKSVLYVPMKIEGDVVGVMQVQSTQLNAYTKDDIDLLAGLANVAAVAVRNAQLIKETEANAEDLQATLDGIIKALAATTETRDPYTAGHQQRVTSLAVALAEEMSIPDHQKTGIRVASLLHDIGKMSIPAEILSKPTKLTEMEFALIKNHPKVAYDILRVIDFPWPVADIVLQHHERLNGSGYPNGLKGDEILLEARIICVADVVEAMSSHRPYRPACGLDKALEEIKENAGKLYDPKIVDACLKLFANGIFKFAD